MSLKDLFDKIKSRHILPSSNLSLALEDAESPHFVDEFIKDKNRFEPHVDYSTGSNFAKYGMLQEYYDVAIKRIRDTYPYDGSGYEKLKWLNESNGLDLYIFREEYPRTTGYARFSPSGWGSRTSLSGNYGNPATKEYIYLEGGPHVDNLWHTASNRTSNLEIDGNRGNTIEFWLKKSAFQSLTKREVVFDAWTTGSAPSTHQYGRFTIELDRTRPQEDSPWVVTYQSASSGFKNLYVSGAVGLHASASDGAWHHYAFTLQNTGSQVNCRLYVDGELKSSVMTGSAIGNLNTAIVGTIGSLVAAKDEAIISNDDLLSTQPGLGFGKLSGSIDEFRYWKVKRDATQIGRYWNHQVQGGSNTDYVGSDLGVYYKFNEGITKTGSVDRIVLDYAGRVTNGTWVGYTSNSRSTKSAIIQSSASLTEFHDPIIHAENPRLNKYVDQKRDIAIHHDFNNPSCLYYTFPSWVIEEEGQNGELKKLSQIMGSYFDGLFLKIQELSSLKHHRHEDYEHKPLPFMGSMLRSKGLYTPEIFLDADVLASISGRDDYREFEQNLHNIKNLIYTNIYNNLTHIFKTKGTENSFRNILRCYGIDDELIKINIYSDGQTFDIKQNYFITEYKTKCANFAKRTNFGASVYQYSSSVGISKPSSLPIRGYISGSHAGDTSVGLSFTSEAEIIFPHYPRPHTGLWFVRPVSASLFGCHTVPQNSATPAALLTWPRHAKDFANFEVYAAKHEPYSRHTKFILTASSGYVPRLETKLFYDVYDNNKWNIAVRVTPKGNTYGNTVSGSVTAGYNLEFYGINVDAGVTKEEFLITASLNEETGSAFHQYSKRFYVGAHREDYTGSIKTKSDVRLSSFRHWASYLDNEEIRAHAIDPRSYGVNRPMINPFTFQPGIDAEIPKFETLALHWNFDTVTGSSEGGQFFVHDFSSGSTDKSRDYAWVGDIVSYNHPGRGDFFEAATTASVDVDYIYSARKQLPESIYSSDMINVLSRDEQTFTRDSRPVGHYFAIEKSMYQAISEEMLNMFSTIHDFNNLIGDPVNRYRPQYKSMEKLRQMFFSRIENTPSIEKYVEFYKWIDHSLSVVLDQFKPASANFSEDVRTMIESHALERNKYWTKYPTMEMKNPDPEGHVFAINELLYNWRFGHAPINDQSPSASCMWWKERANRNVEERITSGLSTADSDRETIRRISFTEVSGNTYAVRHLTRPVKLSMDLRDTIRGGSNFPFNKRKDFYIPMASPDRHDYLRLSGSDIDFGDREGCQDILYPRLSVGAPYSISFLDNGLKEGGGEVYQKNRVYGKVDVSYTERKDLDINILAPFSLYSCSIDVPTDYKSLIYRNFKKNVDITNIHSDAYGEDREIPIQGPFTEFHIGGHFHRHNPLNTVGVRPTPALAEIWFHGNPADGQSILLESPVVQVPLGARNAASSSIYVFEADNSNVYRDGQIIDADRHPVTQAFNIRSHYAATAVSLYHAIRRSQGKWNLKVSFPKKKGKSWVIRLEQATLGPAGNTTIHENLDNVSTWGFEGGAEIGDQLDQRGDRIEGFHITMSYDRSGNPEQGELFVVSQNHYKRNLIGTNEQDFLTSLTSSTINRAYIYREPLAKRPVNIRNIRSTTSSLNLGNYRHDYEIIQGTGPEINPIMLIKSGSEIDDLKGLIRSPYFAEIEERKKLIRPKRSHFHTSRFSAPGSPETAGDALGGSELDPETNQYSVYNSLNYRNLPVRWARDAWSQEMSNQFGFARQNSITSSAPTASYHKVYRNPRYVATSSLQTEHECMVKFDNEFVRHVIPQSDLGYAWIKSSTIETTCSYKGFESRFTEPGIPTGSKYSTLLKRTSGELRAYERRSRDIPSPVFLSASEIGIATVIATGSGRTLYGLTRDEVTRDTRNLFTNWQFVDFVGLNNIVVDPVFVKGNRYHIDHWAGMPHALASMIDGQQVMLELADDPILGYEESWKVWADGNRGAPRPLLESNYQIGLQSERWGGTLLNTYGESLESGSLRYIRFFNESVGKALQQGPASVTASHPLNSPDAYPGVEWAGTDLFVALGSHTSITPSRDELAIGDEDVWPQNQPGLQVGQKTVFTYGYSDEWFYENSTALDTSTMPEWKRAKGLVKVNVVAASGLTPTGHKHLSAVHADARLLNSLLLNRNGPYGWPSWKMLRVGEHKLARALRRSGEYVTIVRHDNGPQFSIDRGSLSRYNWPHNIEHASLTNDRTAGNLKFRFKETAVTSKYMPVKVASLFENDASTQGSEIESLANSSGPNPARRILKFSYANNAASYSNPNYKMFLRINESNRLPPIEDFTIGNAQQTSYSETIFPRDENSYTNTARRRKKYQVLWWSTKRKDRKTVDEINSQGFSLGLTGSRWPLDAQINFGSSNEIGLGTDLPGAFGEGELMSSYTLFRSGNVGSYSMPSASAIYARKFPETTYGLKITLSSSTATDYWGNAGAGYSLSYYVTFYPPESSAQPLKLMFCRTAESASFLEDSDGRTIAVPLTQSSLTTGKIAAAVKERANIHPIFKSLGHGVSDGSTVTLKFKGSWDNSYVAGDYLRDEFSDTTTDAQFNITNLDYYADVSASSTLSTHLAGAAKWEVGDMSGRKPFNFRDYDDYAQQLRLLGKDYSIVPEFRISDHMEDFLGKNAEDPYYYTDITSEMFSLTGASGSISKSDNSDFFKIYGHTDFIKHFEVVESAHTRAGFKKNRLTLKCKGLKKLLPYEGFYPVQRTLQLATYFSQSYGPATAISPESYNDPSKGGLAGWRTTLAPFYAPGIAFNSIKSGIAVDYPAFVPKSDRAFSKFCVKFDKGDGNIITIGDSSEWAQVLTGSFRKAASSGSAGISLSLWFWPDEDPDADGSSDTSGSLINFNDDTSLTDGIQFRKEGGRLVFGMYKSSTNYKEWQTKPYKSINSVDQWYHLAVAKTFDGTAPDFWINGNRITAETGSTAGSLGAFEIDLAMDGAANCSIGNHRYATGSADKMHVKRNAMECAISEVSIFNDKLDTPSVVGLYGGGQKQRGPYRPDICVTDSYQENLVGWFRMGNDTGYVHAGGSPATTMTNNLKMLNRALPKYRDTHGFSKISTTRGYTGISTGSFTGFTDAWSGAAQTGYGVTLFGENGVDIQLTGAYQYPSFITGSVYNETADGGIPRIGSASWGLGATPDYASDGAGGWWAKGSNNTSGIQRVERIPFETIVDPSRFLKRNAVMKVGPDAATAKIDERVVFYDTEPHPSASLQPCSFMRFRTISGSRNSSHAIWSTAISSSHITSSLSLTEMRSKGDTTYSKAASNFYAETLSFFLRAGHSTILSSEDTLQSTVQPGQTYSMRLRLIRPLSPDFPMYNRPMAFGPPVDAGGGGIKDNYVGHGFSPFTPPHYDGYAEVEYNFVPHVTESYSSVEDVIRRIAIDNTFAETGPTIRYNRYVAGTGSNNQKGYSGVTDSYFTVGSPLGTVRDAITAATSSLNKAHAMQLSASFYGMDLSQGSLVSTLEDSKEDKQILRKSWVIQSKWETPNMDFRKVVATRPKPDFIGYPKGMWHQTGSYDDSTTFLEIRGPVSKDQEDLAALLGMHFKKDGKKIEGKSRMSIGQLPEAKTIREAVVAVPFIESKDGTRSFFEIPRSEVYKAVQNLGYPEYKKKFLARQEKALLKSATPGVQKKEELEIVVRPSIQNMVEKMFRYVFPPKMNFLKYNSESTGKYIKPFAMYIFEFEHKLTKKDIAYMWQNTSPDIALDNYSRRGEDRVYDESVATHELGGDLDLLGGKLNSKVKWMVFKVKQKAETNYFKKIERDRLPKRHPKLRKFVEDDVFEYGYNWPYDYFSLVELIKIDASLDFKKQGSTNLGDASISEEDRRKIAEKLNITLKSGEDVDIIPKGDPTLG